MSGLKISQQQIDRAVREQLAKKAERESRELALVGMLKVEIDCALDNIRGFLPMLDELEREIGELTVKENARARALAKLQEYRSLAEDLLDYCLINNNPDSLQNFADDCRKFSAKLMDVTADIQADFERWERKQEKLDQRAEEYRLKLEIMEREKEAKIRARQQELQQEETRRVEELLQEYEEEYIEDAVIEVMEEMGCEIVGIGEEDAVISEQLFSFEENVAIHVVEQNCQVSMEIVGVDTVKRGPSEEERVAIETMMHSFDKMYEEVSERLQRRGIKPKDGGEIILPPDKRMVKILNLADYGKPDALDDTVEEAKNGCVQRTGAGRRRKRKSGARTQ